MSLQISNLEKSFSVRKLFSGVTFAVNPGECVALVGSNGSGKTTMMKIILGQEAPDTGKVTSPKDSRIGYLPQEIFLADNENWSREKETMTLWELSTQAFDRLKAIKIRIETIEHEMASGEISAATQDEYDHLVLEFDRAGGYTWQAKTIRLLKGFGFPESRFHDPLKTFSGGWQMRAYFVRLLLSEPDYLLLDEPTNYLDISSISFLEDYLGSYTGGILVVSHDRYFLDELASSVVALMPEGSRTFRGNYSGFLEARETWAMEAQAAQDRQDRERKRVEKFIERFRFKASKASQVQSRIKQLDKIEKIGQVRALPKLSFSFPKCESSGEIVLRGENIGRSYGDHHVLKDVSFILNRGDRLAIIGENGAGKTTLMRILAGEDAMWSGRLEGGYRVHFGYFAQDEEISFVGDETVQDRVMREAPLDAVPQVRNLLGAFLFSGDDVEKSVRVLSGGEKSRLGLARMMLRPCNLLLLDEPTNHLDINSREALLNALEDFPGTIIIVSHDRFFLDSLATRILAIDNGRVTVYDGNYSQYLWARQCRDLNGDGPEEIVDAETRTVSDKKQMARENNKQQKQLSNRLQKLKREIEEAESRVSQLEMALAEVEGQLASPPAEWAPARVAEAARRHADVNVQLEQAIAAWEGLHGEDEQVSAELTRLKEGVANGEQ
ncbi:MAG: ABC transporter ATP-binding protein [Candidatus Riflebacteria bacterium HGW-Riflebacteria-1]|jgi:ATP-binding cassette subfamily F protein 3|nr:MAG: ABC transporter ATP-binding protein [Candidatus Riflebacteria bacterium HGW-Riflebacteria-1]